MMTDAKDGYNQSVNLQVKGLHVKTSLESDWVACQDLSRIRFLADYATPS
jgi:hypothetical protein